MECELKSLQSKIMELEGKLSFSNNEDEKLITEAPINDKAYKSIQEEVSKIMTVRENHD